MTIFKRKVGNDVASCIAGDDDGEFADKGNMLLENSAGDMNLTPCFVWVSRGIQAQLSFPVLSESRGFKSGFSGKCFHRCGEI